MGAISPLAPAMYTSLATAFAVALDQLRVNTLRTLLSTLGVIIGVGALVAVLSLGDGMERFTRDQVERTTDVQTVTLASRTTERVEGVWVPVRDYPVFGPEEASAILREVDWVKQVALSVGGTIPVESPRSGARRETAVTAAMAGVEVFAHQELSAGRFFTRVEDERGASVVVLSHLLATELARPRSAESIIGETVRVNGSPREVIGVLEKQKGERGYSALVPYSSASVLALGGRLLLPLIAVRATRIEDVKALQGALEDWLGRRYGRWERRVELSTQEKRLEQATQGVRIFKYFMGAIAAISLLVGGIGIMNVMLASVTERTREIGVRKAIGARPRDVLLQFLSESVAISSVGSALGIVLGTVIASISIFMIRRFTGAEGLVPSLSLSSVVVAAGSAVAIGLIFGTYPARRAARLSPIDAIRHE
jgi:putative ABC transport system permease protein